MRNQIFTLGGERAPLCAKLVPHRGGGRRCDAIGGSLRHWRWPCLQPSASARPASARRGRRVRRPDPERRQLHEQLRPDPEGERTRPVRERHRDVAVRGDLVGRADQQSRPLRRLESVGQRRHSLRRSERLAESPGAGSSTRPIPTPIFRSPGSISSTTGSSTRAATRTWRPRTSPSCPPSSIRPTSRPRSTHRSLSTPRADSWPTTRASTPTRCSTTRSAPRAAASMIPRARTAPSSIRPRTTSSEDVLRCLTAQVMRTAPCPVLVVRELGVSLSQGTRERGPDAIGFKKVLVPLDFSECSRVGLDYVSVSRASFDRALFCSFIVSFLRRPMRLVPGIPRSRVQS